MIEIPGYRVIRQLGRGGMATVYLAIQQSVDREVALKIMRPHLLADPNFGDRFLREARIAAKLHHRHVVGIHDVGKFNDQHYIAMEYLSGGSIISSLPSKQRDVLFALRIVREIATALGYAHSKGFVHRDVKPDNIILRHDGSAVLTDFGIARASDSATRMTQTGAVIGTPHYMSPEQARGKPIDGRADLYSLGVVLYELLVGEVPFHAEDSLAVGIMHITEEPPRLSGDMSALQSMLDRVLAKKPEDRYQTGEEMAGCIQSLEVAIAKGQIPALLLPGSEPAMGLLSALPTEITTPTAAVTKSRKKAALLGERTEPQFGAFDEVLQNDVRRRTSEHPKKSKRGFFYGALGFFILLGMGLIWYQQDALRGFLPNTELNNLLTQAEKAHHDGQLVGSSGFSALEYYQAVLKLDPDNTRAITGINAVGEAVIAQAQKALAVGDLAFAKNGLAQAREILQGGAGIEALSQAIEMAEKKSIALGDVLERAIAAHNAGQLLGGERSALALYRQVLGVDSENAIAKNGIEKIASYLAEQARALIITKQWAEAESRLAELEQVQNNHPALTELRVLRNDAHSQNTQTIEAQLSRAEELMRQGQLLVPENDSARIMFENVLKQDPNNARALAGLSRIGAGVLVQLDAAIETSDLKGSNRLLNLAEQLSAPDMDLRAARIRVRELRERIEISQAQQVLTAEQQTRVTQYLNDADAALAAGNLNEPPGDNAFDLYRAALSIDRTSMRAKAGLAAIAPRARELFEAAVESGHANAARGYLDAFEDASADTSAKQMLRVRLADIYIAKAKQQLADRQIQMARGSFEKARRLVPLASSVIAFEQELSTAEIDFER
jgi:serine/threonine-protein kinase PpkA